MSLSVKAGGQYENDPMYNGSVFHREILKSEGDGTTLLGYMICNVAVICRITSASVL